MALVNFINWFDWSDALFAWWLTIRKLQGFRGSRRLSSGLALGPTTRLRWISVTSEQYYQPNTSNSSNFDLLRSIRIVPDEPASDALAQKLQSSKPLNFNASFYLWLQFSSASDCIPTNVRRRPLHSRVAAFSTGENYWPRILGGNSSYSHRKLESKNLLKKFCKQTKYIQVFVVNRFTPQRSP